MGVDAVDVGVVVNAVVGAVDVVVVDVEFLVVECVLVFDVYGLGFVAYESGGEIVVYVIVVVVGYVVIVVVVVVVSYWC